MVKRDAGDMVGMLMRDEKGLDVINGFSKVIQFFLKGLQRKAHINLDKGVFVVD